MPTNSRRTFLKATAGVVSGVGAGIGAAAALNVSPATTFAENKTVPEKQTEKPVIYKSVKWGMINEKISVLDKFKLMQDLGFDGIELDSPGGANKKQARDASEKTGMPIHGVVDSTLWNIRLSSPDAATREKGLQDLLTAIRDSHFCGASSVLIVAGHGKDGTQEEVASRSIAQIRKALPLAAKLGVHILIENVWNAFTYVHDGPADQTADALAKFIDDCNSPWVGSYFDIGNHRKYGVPSQWAKTLGKRIVKLDVKDFDHKKNKWADIGQGTVDWSNVVAELGKLGFNGWATAEVGGGDRKRLKQIKEQMDQVLA